MHPTGPDEVSSRDSETPRRVARIPEDVYAVATSLQHLVGAAYFGSRERYEDVSRRLIARLPEPPIVLESMWLHEKLINANARAARAFHRAQGCDGVRCGMPPADYWDSIAATLRRAPRRALARSLAAFLQSFDRHHSRIGVPVRAAKLLRRSWYVHRRMDQVAARLGTSRSTMERLFVERYGLTPRAYHTRVRIRAAVMRLHDSQDKVEYIARCTGYAGLGNFYRTFEACTAVSPSAVRDASPTALARLLRECCEIDTARLYERRNERAGAA